MLPLDDVVVLPGMVVPVAMSDSEARAAVEAAQAFAGAAAEQGGQAQVLLVPRLDGKYSGFGTIGVIEQVGRLRGGEHAAVVRGTRRARIGTGTTGPGAALWVEATELTAPAGDPREQAELAELAREYKSIATTVLQQRGAFQFIDTVQSMTDPAALADLAGYAGYLTNEQKVWLLETPDVTARLRKLVAWSREHLAELDVAETIRKDVQEGMDKQQREFLLRQQLAAVRKELAELNGTPASEEQDYRARVEAADLPDKVRTAALAEVDKLERTSDQSPEVGWIRTWLDTVLELPWNTRTEDSYQISEARAVLDADHAGLDDVKERVIEYLAVRRRRADRGLGVVGGRRSGAVLALVGPPGVGKTSLGESVAR
ncbi:MAG TPA: LON peptidase substrate-binding domain-containing protein, partial [Jatrophihabitans sp.]|nr:LON peptidase substrate-binding domain-containing protein [Jatrophihabitans sp.]